MTQTPSKAVAKQAAVKSDLKAWIRSDAFAEVMKRSLPKHMTSDRMAEIVLQQFTKTPALMKCNQQSLFRSILTLSAAGLRCDGRESALVPYGSECTPIIMVAGLIRLMWQSERVTGINSKVIHANDLYEIDMNRCVKHTPWHFLPPADRADEPGPPIAVWGEVTIDGGGCVSEVMTYDEVLAIRDRSAAGKSGPWRTDEAEMARKTILRRIAKRCPMSDEATEAINADHDAPTFTQSRVTAGGVDALEQQLAGGDA